MGIQMKIKLTYEADYYEDRDAVKILFHASDMFSAIISAKNLIRLYLKHGDIDDKTAVILEAIRDDLYVEGLDV